MSLVVAVFFGCAEAFLDVKAPTGAGRVARRAHDLDFDHVEVYVEALRPMAAYEALENAMDSFSRKLGSAVGPRRWYSEEDKATAAHLFEEYRAVADGFDESDLVAQLICGLNWRTVSRQEWADGGRATIAPPGDSGATFVVTSSRRSREFCRANGDRPGIGALCFRCASVAGVRDAYLERRPELVALDTENVFEAYAYYDGDGPDSTGAVLRFVESSLELGRYSSELAHGAVSDHWVSNVEDRVRFVESLRDALGLEPRVEFDAGVIAAGAASIESTVVGGDAVYLPANNALSDVGHVAAFLREIGQGVQHLASRCDDLVAFVSFASLMKRATGRGFEFLDVPRSYYGRLAQVHLVDLVDDPRLAMDRLRSSAIVDDAGLVDLDADLERVELCLAPLIPDLARRRLAAEIVLFRRYANIHAVLGDRLSPEDYVRLVRARVLVDVQGDDALLQIFTTNILQPTPDREAPFLEFIQRVCGKAAEEDGRFGCGGFGIRNFLALFLSIELNAAMQRLATATDDATKLAARAKIECLATQLDLSTPILQNISNAGLAEAQLLAQPNPVAEEVHAARQRKLAAQAELQAISATFAQRAVDIDASMAAARSPGGQRAS